MLEKDRIPFITILEKIEMYQPYRNITEKYYSQELKRDEKIQLWCLKEIYLSSYKVYLNKLNRDKFIEKYLKAKKYISNKTSNYEKSIISYFIACLQDYFDSLGEK